MRRAARAGFALAALLLGLAGCSTSKDVACLPPCDCECHFELDVLGDQEASACGGTGGYIGGSVRATASASSERCRGDFDRAGTGNVQWTQCRGGTCTLDSTNFPPGSPIPYDPRDPNTPWVDDQASSPTSPPRSPISRDCFDDVQLQGHEDGWSYDFLAVKGLKAQFDIDLLCHCRTFQGAQVIETTPEGSLLGEVWLLESTNRDTLAIDEELD